jgi:glycopeptide antibiotics resistance protein
MVKLCSALWLCGWAAFGLPWRGVSQHRRRPVNTVPFRAGSYRRSDLAMNFAYYVPMGLLGEVSGWPSRATVVTAALLSALTEVLQVFSRDRYPSVTDVILNTAGALAGVTIIRILTRFRKGRSQPHPPTRA